MILRFYDFQKFEIAGLTPWSKWVALVGRKPYPLASHILGLDSEPNFQARAAVSLPINDLGEPLLQVMSPEREMPPILAQS